MSAIKSIPDAQVAINNNIISTINNVLVTNDDKNFGTTFSFISTFYNQTMNTIKSEMHNNNLEITRWSQLNDKITKKHFLRYLQTKDTNDLCNQIITNGSASSWNNGMISLENNRMNQQNNLEELNVISLKLKNNVEKIIFKEWIINFLEREDKEYKGHLCFFRDIGGQLQLQLFTIKYNEISRFELSEIYYSTISCHIYIRDFLSMKLTDMDMHFNERISNPEINKSAAIADQMADNICILI